MTIGAICAACHERPAVLHRLDAPLAKLCEPCYTHAKEVIGELVRKYQPLTPSLTVDEVKVILEDEDEHCFRCDEQLDKNRLDRYTTEHGEDICEGCITGRG